ncbi:MAG: hypothetical protein FJ135_00260 [Deltaproteobacteria bacterium]|nr:hypothetical protein [Deltaproteobacteria bacterium]
MKGAILLQKEYPIDPGETLHSLIAKSKDLGAQLIIEVVDQFKQGTVQPKENDPQKGAYYGFPDRLAVKQFLAKGLKFR